MNEVSEIVAKCMSVVHVGCFCALKHSEGSALNKLVNYITAIFWANFHFPWKNISGWRNFSKR